MDSNDITLFLFTEYYPFSYGEEFLETEIKYLAQRFSRIIIIPNKQLPQKRTIPSNVEVVTSFSKQKKNKWRRIVGALTLGVFSLEFLNEALHNFGLFKQPKALYRAASYRYQAKLMKHWLQSYLQSNDFNLSKVIFYTYWFNERTWGIGELKERYPQIQLISRGHGHDIYEDQHIPLYLPFRKQTLQNADLLLTISEHGKQHILKYHATLLVCEVMRLGILDRGIENPISTDKVLRIVSCSYCVPVKRLHLLVEALQLFGEKYPQAVIEWNHLGDGPLRAELEQIAQQKLPSSIKWSFQGRLSNKEVFEFYKINPIDVFVNVSASEGIPVSIMEAQSCSIPVIATAVGGIPEIVNEQNGILLSQNPSPQQIADALASFAFEKQFAVQKRSASRFTWRSTYNAETNYNAFIDRILQFFKE